MHNATERNEIGYCTVDWRLHVNWRFYVKAYLEKCGGVPQTQFCILSVHNCICHVIGCRI